MQACILHLIRNTFRYASRRDWDALSKQLRPVYTAATEQAAAARFDEFAEAWDSRYPAIVRLWRTAWSEFIPFLDYDVEIRRIICSTTPSSPSTPDTAGRSGRAGTSRPSRPR